MCGESKDRWWGQIIRGRRGSDRAVYPGPDGRVSCLNVQYYHPQSALSHRGPWSGKSTVGVGVRGGGGDGGGGGKTFTGQGVTRGGGGEITFWYHDSSQKRERLVFFINKIISI